MNPQSDTRFYERVLAVVALAVLAFLFYRIVEPFLTPLAWAIFLGFLLQPLHARLARLLRGRDSVSALLLTVLVLILFVGPLAALAVAFARQAGELAGMFQLWITEHQDRGISDLGNLPVIGPL
ncbi:MAG: AI-2E family transporter, partial [Woeseiaceae bacterium]